MATKTGWIQESTYGTSPLSTPATDKVYRWGFMNSEYKRPWHKRPFTAVHDTNNGMPTALVPGQYELEGSMRFCPVHAWEFVYAGWHTITSGGAGVYILEPAITTALRSRTAYDEYGSDIIEAQGLMTVDLDTTFEIGEPTIQEVKLKGSSAKTGTIITTSGNPFWPASLAITEPWGWQHITDIELQDNNVQVQRFHIGIHNTLQPKRGMMNSTGTAANYSMLGYVHSAQTLMVDCVCTFDDDANGFWEVFKAATADRKFEAEFTSGSYYWKFLIYNINWSEASVTMLAPGDDKSAPQYSVTGSARIDLGNPTNLPRLTVKDGSAYS
jgi:hypothetical protein